MLSKNDEKQQIEIVVSPMHERTNAHLQVDVYALSSGELLGKQGFRRKPKHRQGCGKPQRPAKSSPQIAWVGVD